MPRSTFGPGPGFLDAFREYRQSQQTGDSQQHQPFQHQPIDFFDPEQVSNSIGERRAQFDDILFGYGDNPGVLDEFLNADFGSFDPSSIRSQLEGVAGSTGADVGSLRGLADKARGISTGSFDPRFKEFQDAQFDVLNSEQQSAESAVRTNLARSGNLLSGAGQNAVARQRNQFSQQRRSLASEIGLQGLQRGDQARREAGSLYASAGGLDLQRLGLESQNLLASGELGFRGVDQANEALGAELNSRSAGLEAILGSLGIDLGFFSTLFENDKVVDDFLRQRNGETSYTPDVSGTTDQTDTVGDDYEDNSNSF